MKVTRVEWGASRQGGYFVRLLPRTAIARFPNRRQAKAYATIMGIQHGVKNERRDD